MTVLWVLLGLLVCFLIVIIARALVFRPRPIPAVQAEPFPVDEESVTAHFQAMIRLKTISNRDESLVDLSAFEQFQLLLPKLYPAVYAACDYEIIGRHGILLRWRGLTDAAPSVLMAHYDVVPVHEAEWEHPAFDGEIRDGELWGRGTLDTKGTLLGALEAADALIKRGFQPQNDVYFAFGGDEECMGMDASAIVDELSRRGVRPSFVLDEGGAIVEGVFPGVTEKAALIGIAEKGSVFMDLTAKGKSGHASAPPAVQSVGILSGALKKLCEHPMPFLLTKPAKELFDLLGRYSTFAYKLIFANLWCFAPLLNLICKASGGEMNALVRTTCALTRLSASDSYNVLPGQSKAGVNLRVICGETIDEVKSRMEKTIGDPRVTLTFVDGNEASPVSPTTGDMWERLSTAIRQTYPDALVAPYLMIACSDSRHYCRICENVYRFSGIPLSKEQRGMIHGANERIPLNLLPDAVRFFARVLMQC